MNQLEILKLSDNGIVKERFGEPLEGNLEWYPNCSIAQFRSYP